MCTAAVLLSRTVPLAVVTSSTPCCSAFSALCGYDCSDSQSQLACVAGVKGGHEKGKKMEKRESPPPPALSLSWPTVTFFYWLTMFRRRWLVYFYFYFFNYCVETTLLNGFSFSLSLLHSPNIHLSRDFFRSKLPLVSHVQSRFYNLKFASKTNRLNDQILLSLILTPNIFFKGALRIQLYIRHTTVYQGYPSAVPALEVLYLR